MSTAASLVPDLLTLYQPMTHICVMRSHKPIRIYMGVGVNTLYRLFCFFKLFPMVGKGLMSIVMLDGKPETLEKNSFWGRDSNPLPLAL